MLLSKSLRIRINRKAILFFLMMFVIQTPRQISIIESENQVVHLFLIGVELLVYALIFLKWIIRRKLSPTLILSILMYGTIVLSTAINNGSIFNAIRHVIGFVFMVMLIDNEADDIDTLWKACIAYLTIMIIINFITIIMYPEGMSELRTVYTYNGVQRYGQIAWFLTGKNGLGKYILCLLFFKADIDLKQKNRLSLGFYIIAAISYISLIQVWSAASITVVPILLLFILFAKTIVRNKFKLVNVYLLSAVIVFSFIIFVLIGNASIFSRFLTNVLKKSVTFNGRVPIWDASILKILAKPVLGYGYISGDDYRELIGYRAASDSHNYFLTVAIYGGIIAVIFLIVLLIKVLQSIRRIQYTNEGVLLTGFIFSFFLLMLFENTSMKLFWLILCYAYYLGKDRVRLE